jgi:hypothetical protein
LWYASSLVETWRSEVGIASIWAIDVRVFCTHEYPAYEGWATWDEEKFSAEIGLCCELSWEGFRWVLLTELCELQGYREGNWVARLVDTYVPTRGEADRLLRKFQFVRNQTIEERVAALLGQRRPFVLRVDETVRGKEMQAEEEGKEPFL